MVSGGRMVRSLLMVTVLSDHVFYWTVSALKKQQTINELLVIIVDPPVYDGTKAVTPFLPEKDGEPHFHATRILAKYLAAGKQLGINIKPFLVTSTNIADGIISVAELQNPELLIIPGGDKSHEQTLGNYIREKAKCKVEIVEFDTHVPESDQFKQETEKVQAQAHFNELLHPVSVANSPISIYGKKEQ